MTLSDILPLLVDKLPEYDFELKTQFGREFIQVVDTYKRGARVYLTGDLMQVLPIAPTFRGRMLSGQGHGIKSNHIKDFYVPSHRAYQALKEADLAPEVQLELLQNLEELAETQKGKRNNYIAGIVIGLALIGLGIFLYFEFKSMEESGGSIRLNWLIVLLYETLGKEVTAIVMSLVGGWMIYGGIKGLAGKAYNS